MKYFKRLAALLALVLCVTAFAACGDGGLEDISKDLPTYTIEAEYDEATHTLTGTLRLDYVNRDETEHGDLAFHLYGAAYREGARFSPVATTDETSAYPDGKSYGDMKVSSVKAADKDVAFEIGGNDSDILLVTLPDKILPGGKISVDIAFTTTLANVRHRLGYSGKTVNLGGFYPVLCVYENGSYRTDPYYANGDPFYTEIANYNVTLKYPSKYKIACTGAAEETHGESVTTATSGAKAVRDFAATLGEFECKETAVGNTRVKYCYYADANPDKSLKAAADALKTFSERFGEYPYETFTVAQTALLQGGMEYPNFVMVSDKLNESIYIDAIIHETAHQWWYGIVGNNEVDHAWLDEALAEYSTSLFYKLCPEYEVDFEKRISDAMTSYLLYIELYKPGIGADTSMDRTLGEYANAMEYTYMTYVKGQLMFDNLRRMIGDDNFFGALKAYFTENYLGIAKPDNLVACFEKASSRELKGYFDSWVEGKVQMFAH